MKAESQDEEQTRAWAELKRSGEAVLARLRSFVEGTLDEVQGTHPPIADVMSRGLRTCSDDDTLDVAARILWECDCGCVPVVTSGAHPRVLGMLTDRDICMAAYTTGSRLSEIRVARARSRQAWCVPVTASIEDALAIMRLRRVHRLPVVDAEGGLVGLLSLIDVALRGRRQPGWKPLTAEDPISRTFTSIRTQQP